MFFFVRFSFSLHFWVVEKCESRVYAAVYKSWRMPCCYHSDFCYSLKQNPSGIALFLLILMHCKRCQCICVRPYTYLISIDGYQMFSIVLLSFWIWFSSVGLFVRSLNHSYSVCESVFFTTVNTQPFNLLESRAFTAVSHVPANFPPATTARHYHRYTCSLFILYNDYKQVDFHSSSSFFSLYFFFSIILSYFRWADIRAFVQKCAAYILTKRLNM